MLAGLQQRMRAGGADALPVRRPGEEDAVIGAVGPLAPAVENAEDDGAGTLGLAHLCHRARKSGWCGNGRRQSTVPTEWPGRLFSAIAAVARRGRAVTS